MSQQYLLPCECGNKMPVTAAQAGRIVACSCGRELVVPNLGALRQLEPALVGTASKQPAEWNAWRGVLFVAGILLTIVGLIVGGYGSLILRQIDVEHEATHFNLAEVADIENVEKMPPADVYELWKTIASHGPGQAGTARPLQAQAWATYYRNMAIAGFVVAAVGLVMAGSTLVGGAGKRG
jgi:hypothetical protein